MLRLLKWLVCFLALSARSLLGIEPAEGATLDAPGIVITAAPASPIIETRDGNHLVNFDFIVRNAGNVNWRISKIELSAYDSGHHLALRKALNTDAFAPSIAVIGNQLLPPGGNLDIFNPFFDFEAEVPLDRLDYSFCLQRENTQAERDANPHRLPDDCDLTAKASVVPRAYAGKTDLALPLHGKVFVWEGHDFYAHHLRVPLGNAKVKAIGITANSNEFAEDFIYADEKGGEVHGDPRKNENWLSYGRPIFAPGKGVVVASANDIPDNHYLDASHIAHPDLPSGKDPKDIGNFVLVDHGDGEFSLLVHMKPGSVRMKAGDAVAQGEEIGQIGFSGDSLFPHLHYSLMAGPEVTKSWGLPAYFRHFHRWYGAKSVAVARGPVNSGDFVENDASSNPSH